MAGYTPGSCVVTGSSELEENVDSVSLFVTTGVSVDVPGSCCSWGAWSPEFLKYPPSICVMQCSFFCFRRRSIRFTSFRSSSSGHLGFRICLYSFLL